jgi:hypothetical protein
MVASRNILNNCTNTYTKVCSSRRTVFEGNCVYGLLGAIGFKIGYLSQASMKLKHTHTHTPRVCSLSLS